MKFNINHNVKIKLTDRGREILYRQHQELNYLMKGEWKYIPPEEDKDGWSIWQLWSVMEKLGPYVGLGERLPFGTNIEIIEENN